MSMDKRVGFAAPPPHPAVDRQSLGTGEGGVGAVMLGRQVRTQWKEGASSCCCCCCCQQQQQQQSTVL